MEQEQLQLRPLAQLQVGEGVKEVLVSPTGVPVIVTAQTLFVLDVRGGGGLELQLHVKHAIQGQQAGITAATLSGKGSELIAGGADGFLKWWHLSGEETCSTMIVPAEGGAQQQLGNGAVSLAITAVAAAKGSNLVAVASGR